jgi:hypothetical protein
MDFMTGDFVTGDFVKEDLKDEHVKFVVDAQTIDFLTSAILSGRQFRLCEKAFSHLGITTQRLMA